MCSYVFIVASLVVLWRLFNSWRALHRNIIAAKATGLPYRVSPISGLPGLVWLGFRDLFLSPLKKHVPVSRRWLWPKLLEPNRSWEYHRELQDTLGETYLIVSPSQIFMSTSNAEINAQITHRRNDFVKPVEVYTPADIFGPSILTTEGSEWRRHRKVVAPAFSEKNSSFVWRETLKQTNSMIDVWAKQLGNHASDMKIRNTSGYTAQLALHITCAAGFGVKQLWDGEDESRLGTTIVPGFNTRKLSGSHRFSFKDALSSLLHNLMWLTIFPQSLLRISPFETHQRAAQAHSECADYFAELAEWKLHRIEGGQTTENETLDTIIGPLIKASEYLTKRPAEEQLTKREVISDLWITLLAGHDTVAQAAHMCFLYNAICLDKQATLQQHIDAMLGSRPVSTWTYDTDASKLWKSMLGATILETLRLMPPVFDIPKVVRERPQTVTCDGKPVTVPANTMIFIALTPIHRNLRYWPTKPSLISSKLHDLDDFVPERWFSKHEDGNEDSSQGEDDGEDDGLYSPRKGTFLPWSDGERSCPGRKFAQVELIALFAVIFQSYSVELDVSEWASDEAIRDMDLKQRKAVYGQAMARARALIDRSTGQVGMLRMAEICPLRIVKRGLERFADCF